MSLLLYNILIRIYGGAIKIAAAFGHEKARKRAFGQKNLFKNLRAAFRNNTKSVVWFHCASLGEFEQARPVIELVSKYQPELRILLTFFSPSGYEIRKNYEGADDVFYLPLDTRRNARHFLDIVQPQIALFVKYEFWYHFMREAKYREIPVILFSAIFRDDQLFFKPYGRFYRSILKYYSKIFVQNRHSTELLEKFGILNIEEAGDTRFDRVIAIAEQRRIMPDINQFKGSFPLMVIGSSWPDDLSVLVPIIESFPELKFIIAPHEIKEKDIKLLMRSLKRPTIRYSQLKTAKQDHIDILIVDSIGFLSSLYGYADFAYVGGAFGKGLHNILEAAVFGIPVFFGPHYTKFKEATDLIQAGGAFSVQTTEELRNRLRVLFDNHEARKSCGDINKHYVHSQQGASKIVYQSLVQTLSNSFHLSEFPKKDFERRPDNS